MKHDRSFIRRSKTSSDGANTHVRRGFTLVELLVGITIFVILASLTMSTFSAATDGDRGPAAAQTFQSWMEGTKSRAAKLGRPVGILPIIDPTIANGHAVREFRYVANIEPLQGALQGFSPSPAASPTSATREWPGLFFDNNPAVEAWLVRQQPGSIPAFSSIDGLNPDGTPAAFEVNLIGPGTRIEIPANSGNWFRIAALDPRTAGMGTNPGTFNPSHDAGSGALQGFYLIGDVPFAERIIMSGTGSFPVSRPPAGLPATADYPAGSVNQVTVPGFTWDQLTYRIELGADVIEGERILSLPAGMFLDLDASTSPPAGFPVDSSGDTNFFDEPYLSVPLMFSPSGEIVGPYQTAGLLSFFFCTQDELVASRANPVHPAASQANFGAWTRGVPPILASPVGDTAAVTVFPRTGFVQKTIINPTDAGPTNFDGSGPTGAADGFADNPYQFRLRGDLDQ